MKTPLTAMITVSGLVLLYAIFGGQIDLAVCVTIIFGTSIVAWTIEQYDHHKTH